MRLIQIHSVGLERLNLPCRHGRYTEDIDKRTNENTQSASLCISYSFVNDRSASIYPLLPLARTNRVSIAHSLEGYLYNTTIHLKMHVIYTK